MVFFTSGGGAMIFDIVALILTLAAIILALAIRERTANRIAHSYSFMLAALGVYALIEIVRIFVKITIISENASVIILGILKIIFVLLLMVCFLLMKKEIKRIDGENDMERELKGEEKKIEEIKIKKYY